MRVVDARYFEIYVPPGSHVYPGSIQALQQPCIRFVNAAFVSPSDIYNYRYVDTILGVIFITIFLLDQLSASIRALCMKHPPHPRLNSSTHA